MSSVAAGASRNDPSVIVVRLHKRYAPQIQRFCRRQLGNREEAEDATQLTFLNALRGLERGATLEFESAWLFKIAANVCQNSRRSSFRRRRVEMQGIDQYQDVIAGPDRRSDELMGLSDALQDLPELQRRAILLREWQGLSYKEIATELALSQAAVETLLFRARRSLAQRLTGGNSKRPARSLGNLGSVFGALKTIPVGAAAKVAASTATVVVASVIAGSDVAPADALQEGAPVADTVVAAAQGVAVTSANLVAGEDPSLQAATLVRGKRAASPSKTVAAVTWPSVFAAPRSGRSSFGAVASVIHPALPTVPASATPSDISPQPADPHSTAGTSAPTPVPQPSPSSQPPPGQTSEQTPPPGQTGEQTPPPATDSTPGDTSSGSTTIAAADGESSTAPSSAGAAAAPSSVGAGGGTNGSPGSNSGGHRGAKGDDQGRAQADYPQPPSDPPAHAQAAQAQANHPQPPSDPPGQAQAGQAQAGQAQAGQAQAGQAQADHSQRGDPPGQVQAGQAEADHSQPPTGPPSPASAEAQPPAAAQSPADPPQPPVDPPQPPVDLPEPAQENYP
jgi:RNA polymerase sigma factor (sigma-70 family)